MLKISGTTEGPTALRRIDEAELSFCPPRAAKRHALTPPFSSPTAAAAGGDEDNDGLEPPLCGVGLELQPAAGAPASGGWVVAAVRPGGPADVSGAVNPGYCILSINGYPIQVRTRARAEPPASAVYDGLE